jgi:hypothetical protein
LRDWDYYRREYDEKERSTHDIAEEHETYPNKIRRELISLGFRPRSKSEAQSAALRHGRHPHPTKGHPLPDDVKDKIRRSVTERTEARHATQEEGPR